MLLAPANDAAAARALARFTRLFAHLVVSVRDSYQIGPRCGTPGATLGIDTADPAVGKCDACP